MDYTITSRPDYVYLKSAGTTIQLTLGEARSLSSALANAVFAAENEATLARQRAKRDACLVDIRPMTECPVWPAPFPLGETRQANRWLTDGWVAVLKTALTAAAKVALNDISFAIVSAGSARGLEEKITTSARGRQVTPAGWTLVHSIDPQEQRPAVVVFSADGNDVVLFDARAWGWAWQATQAATAHIGAQDKLVVFKNAAGEAVAILQNLPAALDWQPGGRHV